MSEKYIHLLPLPVHSDAFTLTIKADFRVLYGHTWDDGVTYPPHLVGSIFSCFLPGGAAAIPYFRYFAPAGAYQFEFETYMGGLVVVTESPYPPEFVFEPL